MPSKLIYAAIFAVFLLFTGVSQWPAAAIQGPLEQGSRGRWSIGGAAGTIWDGGATLLLAEQGGDAAGGSWRVVQNLRWKVSWNELWHGQLAFDVTLERGGGRVIIDSANIAVEKLDAQLPASILGGLMAGPLGRYGWSGTLTVRSPAFKCSRRGQSCSGDMELLWMDAGVAEIPGPVLGSYRLSIVGEGPSVHFDLNTIEGRLEIVGKGEVGAGGLRFTGEAAASGADSGPLQAQLRTLGRPAGSPGRYVIEYREARSAR